MSYGDARSKRVNKYEGTHLADSKATHFWST